MNKAMILAVIMIGSFATTAAAQVSSDFGTDTDGWLITGDNSFWWEATGGNPDGYLFVDMKFDTGTMKFAPLKQR